MKIYGIIGKARSGKDTVAKHLWAKHAVTRIAFADPLKLAAQHMFGLTGPQTWDDSLKEVVIPHWGMTPRRMFQLLGTEASKPIFGNDIWTKRWQVTYEILKDTDDVVIPDVRFDVEVDMIRSLGGYIIEVQRGHGLDGDAGAHASESGISSMPDYRLDNNGTLEELAKQIDDMVEHLR